MHKWLFLGEVPWAFSAQSENSFLVESDAKEVMSASKKENKGARATIFNQSSKGLFSRLIVDVLN